MSIVSYALNGNLNNFMEKLDDISKKSGKSKLSLMCHFVKCFRMIGSGYSDYLNYELYKRSDEEIKKYATIKTQDYFYEIVSPSAYKTAFTIKSNFLKNFAKYIDRESFYKGSLDELKEFLKRNEKIIYKPVNSLGGDRVKAMYSKDIEDIESFYNEIVNNDIQLETYIIQHPEINAFAPNSVNTIRIMTFGYNGESEILAAFLRVGNGIADVDNFHQGGMGIKIDINTGKLVGDAFDKDNNIFKEHPVSHIKFDGFKIPNWDIIVKTVKEAALVNEHIHVVGWDVAVTKDGCTFVEGNRRPGFDLVQVAYNCGRKDIMNKCLDKINAKEGTHYQV